MASHEIEVTIEESGEAPLRLCVEVATLNAPDGSPVYTIQSGHGFGSADVWLRRVSDGRQAVVEGGALVAVLQAALEDSEPAS